MSFKINSDFDSGNIRVLDSSDAGNIRLEIEEDGKAQFFQWFNFEVSGAAGKSLSMIIENASSASYVPGWENYNTAASYDGETWFRVPTSFDGANLKIDHTPDQDRIFYAYFAAYPTTRYRDFIGLINATAKLEHAALGQTLDGQTIDYFKAGSGDLQMWVIARQHPGESMGSWWMEGFLPALCDDQNAAAATLLERATLHIVPCMNLDGSARGHLRTNAAGIDLNRAWRNTSMDKSPEVYLTREKMRETGVDFFLDVHGDEAIPNNFLDSGKGIPSWDETHEARFDRFSNLLLEESQDFQMEMGYPTAAPGESQSRHRDELCR